MKVQNYSVRILNGKNNPASETGEGYVPLNHSETYSILLRNFSDRDSLALVSVDGKKVACVKVPAKEKVAVDGPFDSDKKFTFYKSDSEEFEDSQLDKVENDDLGLVEVKFTDAGDTKVQQTVINGHTYYIPIYVYDWWWRPWWAPANVTISDCLYRGYLTVTPSISGTFTSSISGTAGGTGNITYTNSVNTVLCSTSGLSSGGTGLSGMADHIPAETEKLIPEFDKIFDHEVSTTIYLRLVAKDTSYKDKPEPMVGFSNKKPAPL